MPRKKSDRPEPERRYLHWTDHPSFNLNPLCRRGGCSDPADPTITDGFSGFCTAHAAQHRAHNVDMLLPFGGEVPQRSMAKLFHLYTDEELGIGVPDDRLDCQTVSKEMVQVG